MANIKQITGSRPVNPVNKVQPENREPGETRKRTKKKGDRDRPKDDVRHIDEYV